MTEPSPPVEAAVVDAVVVGAGFAGLTAARELTREGHDVLVFEGRDRVGGRSFTGSVAGLPADMGGAFVGPTQDAVLALAAELQIPTTPTHNDGKNVIYRRGWARSYRGTIPKLSPSGLIDIGRLRWQFDRIARGITVAAPWEARRARQLDDLSLGDWLRSVRASASSRDLLAIVARVTWGCEPDDVSMLHAARYTHAAGGLDLLPLDQLEGAEAWTDCSTSRTVPSRTGSRAAHSRSPRRQRPSSARASCSMPRCVASSDTVRE